MTHAYLQHAARIVLGIAAIAALAGHVAGLYRFGILDRLDRMIYDLQVTMSMPRTIDDRIVIVDIDERSLARIGRWPWGRDVMAQLIDRLFDRYAVRVVGFDLVFAEPDESSGLPVLERLAAAELRDDATFIRSLDGLRNGLDHDGRFATALRDRPIVLGYYFSSEPDAASAGALPPPSIGASALKDGGRSLLTWRGHGGNLERFQSIVPVAGHFNGAVDFDGLTRTVPMLVEYRGQYYESLSLATVRRLAGLPKLEPQFVTGAFGGGAPTLVALSAGPHRIPVNPDGTAYIPFRASLKGFKYVSAADVYAERVPRTVLEGRIVLLGTTAPALYDLRSTPVNRVFPGVEMHANLVAGILDGRLRTRPVDSTVLELALTVLIGGVLAVALPFASPVRTSVICLVTLLAVAVGGGWSWHADLVVFPLAGLITVILLLFLINVWFGFYFESRQRLKLASLFGQYVPPERVEQMARDPDFSRYSTAGRNEVLTVMFADLRNFTQIAEGLEPDAVRRFLLEYLTEMSEVVHRHHGTVDKYIGDSIMAFWGAPLPDPNHAEHAVRAGLDMVRQVRAMQARQHREGMPRMAIGVGLNTGLVSVGDMGSRLRRAYTAIGDPVNLASRLESLTKYYGVGIIIGERTRELVPDLICRELDRVRVKGRDQVVAVYEPLGFRGEVDESQLGELPLWGQMLNAYRERDWDQAELALLNLRRLYEATTLYDLYAARIERYRQTPPAPDWAGVMVFDRK